MNPIAIGNIVIPFTKEILLTSRHGKYHIMDKVFILPRWLAGFLPSTLSQYVCTTVFLPRGRTHLAVRFAE